MRVQLLDHGYLECVEHWGSDERIIEAARMSTAKGFLGWGPKCRTCGDAFDAPERPCPKPTPGRELVDVGRGGHVFDAPGDEKLLRFLWEHDHATPFEMAGLTFEVQAPIFVFREWHRHRVPFGYNELSARYTPIPDVNYVPTLDRLLVGGDGKNKQAGTIAGAAVLTESLAEEFQDALRRHYERSEALYQNALKMGVPKELARVCVPVGRYSRMRATGNLRGWLGFLRLRMAPNAQHEIRVYANAVGQVIAERFPRTWELFAEGFR
jgi:thymidylate synthase (FAD)